MHPQSPAYVVHVAGPQTIRETAETRVVLLDALREHAAVTLDCTAVTDVDLTFVQIILAARRSAEAAGRGFALAQPPGASLRSVLVRGGLLGAAAQKATETVPGLWGDVEHGHG